MTNDDDRRAAADFAKWYTEASLSASLIGPTDALAETFAKHRLAAERRVMERAALIAEEYDTFDQDVSLSACGAVVSVGIAAAIREEITKGAE